MKLTEKTLNSKIQFKGRIVTLVHDEIELPDGRHSLRELVTHPGGVCIACLNENGEFILVEQYRYAFKKEIIEFPAGKLEPNEDPIEAAQRELIEETGYKADVIIPLGVLYPSVGYLTEVIHLYYAPQAHFVGQNLDDQEFLNVKTYTLDQLHQMIEEDVISDAKTIALVYKIERRKHHD